MSSDYVAWHAFSSSNALQNVEEKQKCVQALCYDLHSDYVCFPNAGGVSVLLP